MSVGVLALVCESGEILIDTHERFDDLDVGTAGDTAVESDEGTRQQLSGKVVTGGSQIVLTRKIEFESH